MSLSGAQRAAVERAGQDACVVAGPGSGKTRVLIERFAWLVEQNVVDPSRILAITFTEKAATEIKKRLIERFRRRADLRDAIERAWASTIDGFCARLLREHAIAAGLAPDFTVLEQGSADRMLRTAAEEALDRLFREQPERMRSVLKALDLSTDDGRRQPDLAAGLIEVYQTMRVAGVSEIPSARPDPGIFDEARRAAQSLLAVPGPEGEDGPKLRAWAAEFAALPADLSLEHFRTVAAFDVNLQRLKRKSAAYEPASRLKKALLPQLEAAWVGQWHADLLDFLREAVARIAAAYAAAKRIQAAVDFADLEESAVRLLESDAGVRRRVASRFDHVLMDELQDTNRLQWRLVRLIGGSFFGVGDINQSIYGFRHAEPELFTRYRQHLEASGATIDQLEENYRSRQPILDTVGRMMNGATGIEPRALTARRDFSPARGPVVERLVGQGEQAAEAEAALVAQRIRDLVDAGDCKFGHIAVLVRTLGSTMPFEQAFDRFQIPFLVTGGRTFLEARETRDLMGFMAALANPLDEIALVGLLRGPLVGLNDEEIYRLGHEGWQQVFEQRFGTLRRQMGFLAPDRLLAQTLDECGFLAALPERARANVEKLLAWIRREHRARPRPLPELLDDLEGLRDTQSESEAPPPDATNAVRLMSVHAAKGLEFPVVFVSALHRGPDRRGPVIAFSPELGLGAKWRNPVSNRGQSDGIHRALAADRRKKEEAEENRLLYVAMTRAEQRLILSYAERKTSSAWQKLAEAAISQATAATEPPAPPAAAQLAPEDAAVDQIMERPLVSAQYDSSVSVTDVALFEACPRKYYLGTYLGLNPTPQGPGTGAIELGLEVHRALAGHPVDSPEALELAGNFQRSELALRAARAVRLEREFDFMLALEDVAVSGQIDLWFEEGGELIVVDYKTDRDDASAGAYALQLRLYGLALEKYAGRIPERAVLYYLRHNRALEVSLAAGELDAARGAVRALRDAQNGLEFPLQVGEQCGRCAFLGGLCPAGRSD